MKGYNETSMGTYLNEIVTRRLWLNVYRDWIKQAIHRNEVQFGTFESPRSQRLMYVIISKVRLSVAIKNAWQLCR